MGAGIWFCNTHQCIREWINEKSIPLLYMQSNEKHFAVFIIGYKEAELFPSDHTYAMLC